MSAFIKLFLAACLCFTIVVAASTKPTGIITPQKSSRGSITTVNPQTTFAITTDNSIVTSSNSKKPISSRVVTSRSQSTQRPGTTPKPNTTTNAADTRSIALTTMLVSVLASLAYM